MCNITSHLWCALQAQESEDAANTEAEVCVGHAYTGRGSGHAMHARLHPMPMAMAMASMHHVMCILL